MRLDRYYTHSSTETARSSSRPRRSCEKDSMLCSYLAEYRERQQQRERERLRRAPSHGKMQDALSRIHHGRRLLAAKLAGLSHRMRGARRDHDDDDDDDGPEDSSAYQRGYEDACLQLERLGSFYRDLYRLESDRREDYYSDGDGEFSE